MSIEIQQIDTVTAPEELLLEMHQYYVLYDAETLPGNPPTTVEQRLGAWRNIPGHRKVFRWLLRDDGEIVAVAVLSLELEDTGVSYARIHVKAEHRRSGFATRLAEPVLATLEKEQRPSVITDTENDAQWEPVLERLGMKKALGSRLSRLRVSDVDWDLMDSWIDKAAERASDYELKYLVFPVDEEYLQRWCDVMMIMNTAPRESLEFEDFTMTPEKWRDIESSDIARGIRLSAHVAIHRPTGDWVGLSELMYWEGTGEQAEQGDTAVHPDHRNKGLGRWLKAAMLKKFIAEHPDVIRINTDNAGSNDPMLSINIEMGYKTIREDNAWQGDVSTIRERIEAR